MRIEIALQDDSGSGGIVMFSPLRRESRRFHGTPRLPDRRDRQFEKGFKLFRERFRFGGDGVFGAAHGARIPNHDRLDALFLYQLLQAVDGRIIVRYRLAREGESTVCVGNRDADALRAVIESEISHPVTMTEVWMF